MSELEEGLLAGQLDEQDEKEKTESGMSLSVAQPLVREWLAKRRANLRPVGTFFNTANFQVSLMMWRNCYLDFVSQHILGLSSINNLFVRRKICNCYC